MCEYCRYQDIPSIAQPTAEHDRTPDDVRDAESAARAPDTDAARRHQPC